MARHRKPGRQPQTVLHFVMEIGGCDFWYHFGLNTFGFSAESYQEGTTLTLSGKLHSPGIAGVDAMKLHLMEYEHAIQPRAGIYMLREDPLGAGSLTKRVGVIDATVSVPRHSLGVLYQVVTTGKTLYALLTAPPFRYGRTVARSFTISTEYPE